jgi:YidC/Oxa1 family membrane protein insertase
MISYLFNLLFFNPIYNGLIFLMTVFSWMDLGVAIIVITIIVKLIIFPLKKKSIKLQIIQKKIEPELKKIKEEFKDNKEEQARKIMDLYKEKGLNPLSSILIMFIQIPIIFALYFVFLKGGLPEINTDILYSFIQSPNGVNTFFIGLVNMMDKSLILAILAGISQYIQIQLILPKVDFKNNGKKRDFKEDLMKSMNLQMKFVMPIIIVVIAYNLPSAIALYWLTSNIFMISQEIFVKRRMEAFEKVVSQKN